MTRMFYSICLSLLSEMVKNVPLNSEVKGAGQQYMPSLFLLLKMDGNSQFLHFFLYHSYLYGTYKLFDFALR